MWGIRSHPVAPIAHRLGGGPGDVIACIVDGHKIDKSDGVTLRGQKLCSLA